MEGYPIHGWQYKPDFKYPIHGWRYAPRDVGKYPVQSWRMGLGGSRLSPPTALVGVGIIRGSLIEWTSTVPADTALVISAGLSSSASVAPVAWEVCTSGEAIPELVGEDAAGKFLWIKQELATETPGVTPLLHTLQASVWGNSGTMVFTDGSGRENTVTAELGVLTSWVVET